MKNGFRVYLIIAFARPVLLTWAGQVIVDQATKAEEKQEPEQTILENSIQQLFHFQTVTP